MTVSDCESSTFRLASLGCRLGNAANYTELRSAPTACLGGVWDHRNNAAKHSPAATIRCRATGQIQYRSFPNDDPLYTKAHQARRAILDLISEVRCGGDKRPGI